MIDVDPSNAAQLGAWDGEEGTFWTARADRFNDGVARYRDVLFDAAAIVENSRVLDIGCGSGQTTREAGRRAPAGSAVGVDLSSSQLKLAASLAVAEQLSNVEFVHADAQVYPFVPESFDIVISRHGAMFFGDSLAAFRNIRRALRPGGRLVLLTWQPVRENEWMGAFRAAFSLPVGPPAAQPPRPGALADPVLIEELLASAGFVDIRVTGQSEPMYFGRDVNDASDFIAGQFGWTIRDLEDSAKDRALAALRADMADHLTEAGVTYRSAAWLIEASV